MQRHTPLQQLKEAKQIARDHGMFVVEKGERFILYRAQAPRNISLGFRADIGKFRAFVERCAYAK